MARWGSNRSRDIAKAVAFRAVSAFIVLLIVATVSFVIFRTGHGSMLFPYYYHHLEDPYLRSEPLSTQYISYLEHTFQGDFYSSRYFGDVEVSSFIYTYAARSMVVLTLAVAASVVIGLVWGGVAAKRSGTIPGRALHLLAVLSLSVPGFLLVYLSFRLDEVLNLGLLPPGMIIGDDFVETVRVALLPFMALTVSGAGFFALVARAGHLRAQRHGTVAGRFASLDHVAPAQYFVVPLLAAEMMLLEPVFSYNGLVNLLLNSIVHLDGPVLMAGFFILTAMVLFLQLSFRAAIAAARYTHSEGGMASQTAPSGGQAPSITVGGPRPNLSFAMIAEVSKGLVKEYLESRVGTVALALLVFLALVGVFAGVISTVDDPVFSTSPDIFEGPSINHLMGTDALGRDLYSMNVYAVRFDLLLVASVAFLSMLTGLLVGFMASVTATFRGIGIRVSRGILSVLSDAALAIPVNILLIFLLIYHSTIDAFAGITVLFVLFMWCWAWWLVARPVRTACSRSSLGKETGMQDLLARSLGRFRGSMFLILARSAFVTKFLVLFALIMSTTMTIVVGWVVPDFLGNELSWELLLYNGYYASGFVVGWWLVYIPILELMLLSVVCYVILNTLECVFEQRVRSYTHSVEDLCTATVPSVNAQAQHAQMDR